MGTIFEEDLNDEFIWTTRETTRDENGVLQGRQTLFDNGVARTEEFENGTLTYQQETDGALDAKPWQSLERYYDQSGQIAARVELRDNDIRIESVYENGAISHKRSIDDATTDAVGWQQIDEYYNPNGERAARIELRDNNVRIDSIYENGALANRVWTDDAATDATNWQRVEEYYNPNGERAARIELRDNNVRIDSVYENGVISNRVWTDDAATDATNWQQVDEYYDVTGERVARIELRDNGISITSEYQDGSLRVQTQEDNGPSNAVSWETNTSYYSSAGQIEAREIVYDNTDVTATFFEQGVRSVRLQFDGDDSASWLVRETLYDMAGQVAEVNTYDTAEDVPPEYGFWDWTA